MSQMRSIMLGLLLGLLIGTIPIATWSSEQIILTHDGAWWQSLAGDQKPYVVQGMFVGYGAGYYAGREAASKALRLAMGWTCANCDDYKQAGAAIKPSDLHTLKRIISRIPDKQQLDFLNAIIGAVSAQQPSFADRTFGTMVEKIDEAYSRISKPDKVTLVNFVECAETNGRNCRAEADAFNR